jgi:DNA-binding transcriptional LysR family regulator
VLDLRRLRYFVAVAESRSFSRAAERLLVAQSAVSRQVGLLERELGVRLLERSTHEVQLTAAGTFLLERGTDLLRDADAVWEQARDFAAGARGRLTIGYSTSTGYETAPSLIRAARAALPDVTIDAALLPSVELGDAVASRVVELALVRCPPERPELCSTVVRRERLGVILRAGHPWAARPAVDLGELAGQPLLLHERAANPRHFDLIAGACRAAGFEPALVAPSAPFDPGFAAVADGTAMGIVGESARQGLPAGVAYVPLAAAPLVDVALLSHGEEAAPHVLRARTAVADAARDAGWPGAVPESR